MCLVLVFIALLCAELHASCWSKQISDVTEKYFQQDAELFQTFFKQAKKKKKKKKKKIQCDRFIYYYFAAFQKGAK